MFFICKVSFYICFFPNGWVYFGEEGICRIRSSIDVGNIEGINQRKSFLIDTGSTDDENFFLVTALRLGSF